MPVADVITAISDLMIDTCLALSREEEPDTEFEMQNSPGFVLFIALTELPDIKRIVESSTSEILSDLQFQNVITEVSIWGHSLIAQTAHGAVVSMLNEFLKAVQKQITWPRVAPYLTHPFDLLPRSYSYDVVNTWHNEACRCWQSLTTAQREGFALVENSLPEVPIRRLTVQLMHETERLRNLYNRTSQKGEVNNAPPTESQQLEFSPRLRVSTWMRLSTLCATSIQRRYQEAFAMGKADRRGTRGPMRFELKFAEMELQVTAAMIAAESNPKANS